MRDEWTSVTVGEVSHKITKGTTPTSLGGSFSASGINFIKVESLTPEGTFIPEKFAFINEETDSKLIRSRLHKDDVLFTIAGTIGRVALVPQWVLPANTNQAVAIIRPNQAKVDPRYLHYALSDKERVRHALTRVVQSVQANFSLSELSDLSIPLPPLAEQQRIASILGALDDKIELSRKMNETLEQMAKALFNSWFVDFDPVHAKGAGNQPAGMDKATADLFPDSFVDSELGKIPKGWRVASFAEHMEAVRGLSYNGGGLTSEGMGLPMHNLNSVYEGGGYKHEGLKFYNGEFKEKHVIRPGDMIVTNTEQGFDHLLIGHAAIVPSRYGDRGIFSHHLYRIRPRSTSIFTAHYLVQLFNNPRWHHWISGFSNGTTINMLPLDALEMPKLVVPPAQLVIKFSQSAKALDDKFEQNLKEIKVLTSLRDTLLPQLLEGELPTESR